MSVTLMAAAWELDIPSTDKLVLLALADWSNATGACWPSMKQLAAKSGLTDRAVRSSIGRLRDGGHLTRSEVPGKGVNYVIHPGTSFRPAQDSPRNETPKTPEPGSPNTLVTTKLKKATPSKAKRANKFTLPSDIPADEWADFEEMRQVTRKPMTDSIRLKCVKRLRKLADDGYPPGDVLSYSTLNNYQGLFPPKDDHNGRSTPRNGMAGHRQPAGGSGDGLTNAIREARANRAAVPWDADDPGRMPRLASMG